MPGTGDRAEVRRRLPLRQLWPLLTRESLPYDGPALSNEQMAERAKALQTKYKFRYDMNTLLEKRDTKVDAGKGQVLTDDFAPVEMLKTITRHNQRKPE